MVRCRKQHKGKEKVVRARGKRMHRARTAWCTARTALTSPSKGHRGRCHFVQLDLQSFPSGHVESSYWHAVLSIALQHTTQQVIQSTSKIWGWCSSCSRCRSSWCWRKHGIQRINFWLLNNDECCKGPVRRCSNSNKPQKYG